MLKQVSDTTNTEIWGHKDNITKIVFEDSSKIYDDAEYTYDISSLQDKSIMAYMINNGDDTYTTYINSDGKITANRYSSNLFYKFIKLTTIAGLENLDTSQVTSMSWMFYGCSGLTTLDFRNADFTNVILYSSMFSNVFSGIQVTVKDQSAKEFIEAKLGSGKGTVTIA